MELQEFVQAALVEVVKGVTGAQTELDGSGALVNPHMRGVKLSEMVGHVEGRDGQYVDHMHFDVAVSAKSEGGVKGGAGIKVMEVGIGVDAGKTKARESVSRISFKVPLMFPTQRHQSAG